MTKEQADLLIAEQKRINELSEVIFKIIDANIRSSQSLLREIKKMRFEGVPTRQISLEFLPLAELGALAVGAQVLLLLRDPWYGYDEILNATFDGEGFVYQDQKVQPTRFIAGWAALPYKLPYDSSDPRFASR